MDLIKSLARSFGFALTGLKGAWTSQRNFRIEIMIGATALTLGYWLEVNPIPILLSATLVLVLELVNSALEAVVDLASPQFHPLAARAKDLAAAAVLLASLNAAIVGLLLLGPPLWQRLFGG